MDRIEKLKELLVPYDTEHIKKRFGVLGDGGYVLSENLVNKTKHVYSLGISDEYTIDLELCDMGIKVFQYDVNDCEIPKKENLSFKKLKVDGKNLSEEIIINETNVNDINLLLMDIEGGEYDIIMSNESNLNFFSQICMEVHFVLDNEMSINFFEKLNRNFTLIHIHANNWSVTGQHENFIQGKGVRNELPDILELTYIRNDNIDEKKISSISCPSELDFANYKPLPDLEMSWWIK